MKIKIQDRDKKILKLVFENRIASTKQIKQFAFYDRGLPVTCRRLSKLRDAGLLEKSLALVNNRLQTRYLITPEGFKKIYSDFEREIRRPHFKTESPDHDIGVGNVRLKFERLKSFKAFLPENVLHSIGSFGFDPALSDLKTICADGALILQHSGSPELVFGVEYECSRKSLERYKAKLHHYYQVRAIDGILYVCSEQSILNSVAHADELVRPEKDSLLLVTLEKDVLKSDGVITFKRPSGEVYELK